MAAVDEKVCKVRQENIAKIEDSVKENTDKIVDMGKVLERVVALIEALTNPIVTQIEKKPSFWDTKKGDLLFKVLVVLGAAIVVMAFGMNINAIDFIK